MAGRVAEQGVWEARELCVDRGGTRQVTPPLNMVSLRGNAVVFAEVSQRAYGNAGLHGKIKVSIVRQRNECCGNHHSSRAELSR